MEDNDLPADQEVIAMVQVAKNPEERAQLQVLAYGGMRVESLVSLKYGDFEWETLQHDDHTIRKRLKIQKCDKLKKPKGIFFLPSRVLKNVRKDYVETPKFQARLLNA